MSIGFSVTCFLCILCHTAALAPGCLYTLCKCMCAHCLIPFLLCCSLQHACKAPWHSVIGEPWAIRCRMHPHNHPGKSTCKRAACSQFMLSFDGHYMSGTLVKQSRTFRWSICAQHACAKRVVHGSSKVCTVAIPLMAWHHCTIGCMPTHEAWYTLQPQPEKLTNHVGSNERLSPCSVLSLEISAHAA